MTKIDNNSITEHEECETTPGTKNRIRIALVALAGFLASVGTLIKNNNDNAKYEKLTIGGGILPKYNAEIYENSDDAWLEQNPYIINNISKEQAQYFYDNEFKVASVGYLYNGEQVIIQSFEEEEDIISKGGTPIWFGVLTQNEDVIYFRTEDVRAYVLPKEKQKTKNLGI